MEEHVLAAEVRGGTGKGVARKLRAAGRIPAVVYGRGAETRSISVDPRELDLLLHGSGAGLNTLIDLAIEGASEKVLLKSLQRDPVRGRYLHADFYRVDLTRKITVSVPVHLVGKARGLEFGGLLDHPLREIEVECLPDAIPEHIEVDVSGLGIGDSIHVGDLTLPPGIEVETDAALSVASVILPAAEEAAAAVEEGAEVAEAEGAEAAPAEEPGGEGD